MNQRIDVTGFNNNTLAPHLVNGQELNNWKKTPLHDFIARLETNGWEMAGTISIYGSYHHFLYFKWSHP